MRQYDELVEQASQFQRAERLDSIHIPPGPRLGDLVVEANKLAKAYGDRVLINDLDFSLPPGGIVGVVGANGAGKTTLFKMITGRVSKAERGNCLCSEVLNFSFPKS